MTRAAWRLRSWKHLGTIIGIRAGGACRAAQTVREDVQVHARGADYWLLSFPAPGLDVHQEVSMGGHKFHRKRRVTGQGTA